MIDPIDPLPKAFADVGVHRSTGYAQMKDGLLPLPVRTSKKRVGLPRSEIEAVNRARIAGRSDAEIRALVRQLLAARGASA